MVRSGIARRESDARPVVMPMTAPRLPPAEMPRISGLAMGLRNSPCITTPHTAREEPTRTAAITRGSRRKRMIVTSRGSGRATECRPMLCRSRRRKEDGGTGTAPKPAATIVATTRRQASTTRVSAFVRMCAEGPSTIVTGLRRCQSRCRAPSARPLAQDGGNRYMLWKWKRRTEARERPVPRRPWAERRARHRDSLPWVHDPHVGPAVFVQEPSLRFDRAPRPARLRHRDTGRHRPVGLRRERGGARNRGGSRDRLHGVPDRVEQRDPAQAP